MEKRWAVGTSDPSSDRYCPSCPHFVVHSEPPELLVVQRQGRIPQQAPPQHPNPMSFAQVSGGKIPGCPGLCVSWRWCVFRIVSLS